MADLIFDHDPDDWCKLQVSIYVTHPDWDDFQAGETVLESIGSTTPTLISDGTGVNVKSMLGADLLGLMGSSKPAGYVVATKTLPAGAPIYQYTNMKWNSIIRAAKDDRIRWLAQGSDPLDPIW